MAVYIYPPQGATTVTAAPGSDFATETTLAVIAGYTDGIETLVALTNTKLDTLHADIDGVETLIGTTNTNTANIKTAVDLTTTAVDSVKTAVDATNTLLTNKLAGSLINVQHDQIVPNFAGALTNVYVYKLAGATVKTLTITYTDATKQVETDYSAV